MTTIPTGTDGTTVTSAVIETRNLHAAYDSNLILHGVDLTISAGQCVAIAGANGSGKSTFIKAVLGLVPVTTGQVKLFGQPLNPRTWRRIGYVPQRAAGSGAVSSSALEVVRSGCLGPRQWWFPRGSKTAAVESLTVVGLEHRQATAMTELSGGQQQRVLIARALVRTPQLLIMDEPLAGIDKRSQLELAKIVNHLRQTGHTIVMVLHEFGPMEDLLDRVVTLASGHIESDWHRNQPTLTPPQR